MSGARQRGLFAHRRHYYVGKHASGGIRHFSGNAAKRLLCRQGCTTQRSGCCNGQQPRKQGGNVTQRYSQDHRLGNRDFAHRLFELYKKWLNEKSITQGRLRKR